ncbi:MAG: tRNA (adenosine(37)-N6)-dimethylallyltransferase MiaA [Dysgonamonadaceae bacterium]|jgi:tRNA dimethylallyltransferase|nr:tRNA (adenosine(37)-N6)-dimethylallyltransferase MiaA [Dysgonamonadaceae bacterium]
MPLLTILGPTASGKTSLAAALAARMNAEVISADSRQVYRGMTIGTGKDLDDYIVDGKQIPYHLIDICEPGYRYNLFEYQRDFHRVYSRIQARGGVAVLCGGTGLYLESVLKGYRLPAAPENPTLRAALHDKNLEELTHILSSYKTLHNKTDIDTRQRAIRAIEIAAFGQAQSSNPQEYEPINSLIIGVSIEWIHRRHRITARLEKRLDEGMLDEVKCLLDSGITPENLMYYGLEYKYLTLYLLGKITFNEMFFQLETAIHQFAKRQMTWFRGMERRGLHIHWIDTNLPMEEKIAEIMRLKQEYFE